jgi:PAS domain S-box-containing protein
MKPRASRAVLAGLAIALPLIVGVMGAYATWRETVTAARHDLIERADLAFENAARFSETQLVVLREVAHVIGTRSDAELADQQAALHADLARLSTGLSQVWDVLVWGRDGTVLATAKLFPVPPSNGADRDYFRALAAGAPGPFVSGVMQGRLDHVTFFNVTVPRHDAGGAFAGALGVALDPAHFEASYLGTGLANPAAGTGLAMLRADGMVLARVPNGVEARGTVWPDFADATRRSPDAGIYAGPPGSGAWMMQYRRVPGLPLYVASSITTAALRQRWWEDVQSYLWFGVIVSILMLTLVGQILRGAGAAERAAADAARRADALARSEARARALFINSPDVRTITQETDDGRFVFLDVNDAVLNTFRWTRDDLVGKTPFDFYPAPMAEEATGRMRECLRLGQPVTYEARRVAAGEIRYFETTLVPVSDPEGGRSRVIVSNSRDITERRRMEAHLRESQRLETLTQLAGGLAHDFNNILVVVTGQLERLRIWLDRNATAEQPRAYVRHAAAGLDRGAALVRRMLNFARRQEAQPEALDIVTLLGNLADFVRVTVGARIVVATELPERDGTALLVRADATQIELAVVNLALNARDAMPDGGRITLSVVERTLATDEPDLAAGRYAVLEVRDSGHGMDEATLARATEPFFTTKAPGKGTGLGLAMARGLAVQTGGALRLSSRPGAGTIVALWLPLAVSATPAMTVAIGTG